MATLKNTGLVEAQKALRNVAQRAPAVLAPAVRKGLDVLAAEVRALAPEMTGHLREAVREDVHETRPGHVAGEVHIDHPDAPYQAAQEFGTSKMPGKGYMRRAADARGDEARRVTEAEIARGVVR
jgi:HK97 gp10 family phage protein